MKQETKNKISEALKGKVPWNKGKIILSLRGENNPAKRPEIRKKISEMRKGKPHPHKGYPHSNKVKEKISKSKRGKRLSEMHKEKISKTLKGRKPYWLLGKKPWNYCKVFLSKEKNPNWRGGVTPLRNLIRNCFKYRQWRSDIFTRDNFTCILCNKKGGYIEVDHYPKSFSKIFYDNKIKSLQEALECEELWNINNGRTLCLKCHNETKTNKIFSSNNKLLTN
jgi:5-methylcytosine-specific restriction endonuclease McrA